MATSRYEIDPHNRLVVRETGRKSRLSRYRHVLDGRFRIGADNTLEYHIKAPSCGAADAHNFPHQLRFKGDWSLTDGDNLKLTLNKWGRQTFGDELILKGEAIKAGAGSLCFAVTQKTKETARSTYILTFEGKWQADSDNRITFRIKREKKKYDVLTFDGIWKLNRRHKIVYEYVSRRGGRLRRGSLLFDGFWDITGKGVLTYYMDWKGKSRFDFRIGRGIAEKDRIKFEIGIGMSRRDRPARKDIIIYGRWAVRKGIGLAFEVRRGGPQVPAMKFEAEARLVKGSTIKFSLRRNEGESLGMEFTISKSMLGGHGGSFIRFLRRKKERAVYIGTGFTW